MTRVLFAKVDAHLDSHPKIVEAGFWGSVVFQYLLRINWVHCHDGHVPSRHVTPRSIMRALCLDEADDTLKMTPEEVIEMGISDATDAELIAKITTDEGDFYNIVGWDERWKGAKSPAERKKKQRSRNVTMSHDESRSVTRCHACHDKEKENNTKREKEKIDRPPRKNSSDSRGRAKQSGQSDPTPKKKNTDELRGRARAMALVACEVLRTHTGRRFSPEGSEILKNCVTLARDFTADDVRAVCDAKCAQWAQDPKMREHLKPSTLLRPSKFRVYHEEDVGAGDLDPLEQDVTVGYYRHTGNEEYSGGEVDL